MSISLEYLLRRKKSTLENFIKKNKLTSYNELVEYCKSRTLVPCEEKEYDSIVNSQKEVKKNVNVKKEVKKKATAKKAVSRKTGKTSKSKKSRDITEKE